MRLAARLFDPPVRTAEMNPGHVLGELLAGEEEAVASAVPERRRQFLAGRTCARRALAELGAPPAPLPAGEDRAPIWPSGIVGSISHTATWCAAAVARSSDGIRALGIDLEGAEPMDAELLEAICLPEEWTEIQAQPSERRGVLGKLLFSAKECAFKCQFALSRELFGFDALRIRFDLPRERFVAVFRRPAGPFAEGDELAGRLLVERGYVLTGMALTS
jgi:4'-phosphopantetheinyl transferase EntD